MLRRVSSAVAALRNPKGSSGTIALSASGTLRCSSSNCCNAAISLRVSRSDTASSKRFTAAASRLTSNAASICAIAPLAFRKTDRKSSGQLSSMSRSQR